MTPEEIGRKHGFRSGLEEAIAAQIIAHEGAAAYETSKVEYVVPARNAKYTPDFVLANGIIIETKGQFVTADRHKHLLIKEQVPGLDIRFVFSNSRQRISKKSTTTYAMWCEKHGFQFADKRIPQSWFEEEKK